MVDPRRVPGALWVVLLLVYLGLAFVFSIIQPLGRTPDEAAHVSYVKFLAENHRLPFFEPEGGGEGGYEAQHPPAYYALMAAVYAAATPLEERWRWHVLRWMTTLLVGLPLFLICRRFFGLLYGRDTRLAFIGTATVMLMPLTLLYTAYVNPDALAMLWGSLALWLATRLIGGCSAAADPTSEGLPGGIDTRRQSLLLGLIAGLALLTKLSAAPVLAVALAAQVCRDENRRLRTNWSHGLQTLVLALLVAGWWYGRNVFYYGTPFIHTTGHLGSGLEFGFRAGLGAAAWLTVRETYLSSWVQRGWFPPGVWTVLLYGVIIVMSALAIVGLVRSRRHAEDSCPRDGEDPDDCGGAGPAITRMALNLSGLLLGLVVLGHQWAYWTMDVEFNAGGRYVLVAMMALALLLIEGVRRALHHFAGPVLWLWVVALVAMNQVSVWQIWAVLNPRYATGWQIFHFP